MNKLIIIRRHVTIISIFIVIVTSVCACSQKNAVNYSCDVDLSEEMPKPQDQGEQFSCVAWATAYAARSYYEYNKSNWKLDEDDHLFSPSFVFNQLNNGKNENIALVDALELIKKNGVCPLSDMPYNDKDYSTQPTDEQKKIALKYKIDGYLSLEKKNIDIIKEYIKKRKVVLIGIPIFKDFKEMNEDNPVWDEYDQNVLGYHTLCVVGFSDKEQKVKVLNSWGENWGIEGYGWITYDMIKMFCMETYVME